MPDHQPPYALGHDDQLDAPIDLTGWDLDLVLELYRRMVLIRRFEKRVDKLFLQGKIPGTIHLSLGQEACAVGATQPLREDDWITITHRGHGQAIAKGVDARHMMAELFARDTGCCRGHGGSLHVGDIRVGAVPGIGIVGAATPIAAGIAYAFRHEGGDRVALSFMGDGSFGEGDTHEGLNLAALWEVPVIYLCENNQYSISTPLRRQMKTDRLVTWADAYGMRSVRVDGNNILAVHRATVDAVAAARDGRGPTLIEAVTYRQGGHKRDDPGTYRPRDEVELWLRRDPITRLRAALEGTSMAVRLDDVETAVERQIDEAEQFAEESPMAKELVA